MMPVSDRGVATDLTGAWVVLRRTVGTTYCLGEGFLCSLREWISGFHDRLRQRPSSLFTLCYLFAQGLLITLMMEAVHTPETSVNIYLTTRQYIPEDSKLHTQRRENLKSRKIRK
jgi:hypothetical protein